MLLCFYSIEMHVFVSVFAGLLQFWGVVFLWVGWVVKVFGFLSLNACLLHVVLAFECD